MMIADTFGGVSELELGMQFWIMWFYLDMRLR